MENNHIALVPPPGKKPKAPDVLSKDEVKLQLVIEELKPGDQLQKQGL